MAAIFTLIGLIGVLAGAAATAAGLYETFGETQKAVDAWVSGAQVFFSGAMLMALGSVAARVRGTTKAVEDLTKAVRTLRGEIGAAAPAPGPVAEPERRKGRAEAAADSPVSRPVAERDDDLDGREPVLERRATRGDGDGREGAQAARRTRLGPALGEERGSEPSVARRGARLRRSFDED
ncbi:hypothetical protein ACFOGJ_01250 [Marinibaculum pumilum]|uniref:Uncharacterized protein n=1 Tax=Marinibaculum pumilum TaxID=1766165 RepID=A0ABV7KU79_9PROT